MRQIPGVLWHTYLGLESLPFLSVYDLPAFLEPRPRSLGQNPLHAPRSDLHSNLTHFFVLVARQLEKCQCIQHLRQPTNPSQGRSLQQRNRDI